MEISQVPIQQEIKTEEDELPNLSASALKRPRCLSDMDTSDSEIEGVDPKRMRPSATEEREEKSNVQNIDVTGQCNSSDTSAANSVPHHGWMLWSHVQKKIREPLIGLSAIYECVCNDHAPIYLCECCGLIFKEQFIAGHLSETRHYKNYLGMVGENPLPHGKTYKEDMSKLAIYWERSKGYGEAQVVELTPGEFSKLGLTSKYHKALRIVKNHLASQTNNITCVDTTTANTQNTPQQDVQMDIDPEPVTAPAKTNISSKTETNCKSNPEIFMTRPQSPEKTTTTTATASCSLTSTLTITATTPTIHSLSEDTTLNTGDKTPTVKPNNPTTSVVPEAESKTASISNKLEYIVSTSSTTDTPTFMNAKSANQNMSKPAMTLLAPPSPNGITIFKKSSSENMRTSPCDNDDVTPNNPTAALSLLEDSTKVTDCPPISDDTISNAAKDAPNPQDALTIQIHSIPTDLLYAIKAETSTESSQTKPPAKSRPKTMDNHIKNKEKKLKLNVKAATRITKDGPVHKIDSFTATTPESDPQTPTTEVSVKATSTTHKIGVDHLLKVSCKDSTHTYCFVCSVKLEKSDHLASTSHQINCVKAKYPSWSSKPNEIKLSDMVSRIADDEKALKIECEKIEVASDVYKELKSLPDDKAIEKVKGMIKKKSSKNPAQRRPSAQTSATTSSNFSVHPSGKENGLTKPQTKSIVEPIKNLPVSSPNPTVQKPMSKVSPRIIKGSTTDDLSNLFHIVKVMDRPVIGLSFVWECRVVPPKLPTFYLCESCRQTISVNEIYEHMASAEHRWKYIMRQYPRFMYWIEEELIPEMTDELTNDIAGWVFCHEELMDAQPVLLSEECFEWVRTAPFVEALSVVQRIKQEKKTTTLPLIVTSQNDLPNQMEMSPLEEDRRTTDSDHAIHGLDGNAAYANAESRLSPTEYLAFPHITHRPPCSIFSHQEISEPENEASSDISTPLSQTSEPLVSQPPSTSPPEIPEHIPSCSVNQSMPASPKYENQEDVEPENTVRADVSTPLSHDSAVGSPGPIDSIGTTTLKDTSNNTTHETEIKPKLSSVHEMCSSAEMSKHNENVFKPIQEENVALEGSPRHSGVLTGESTSLASSTAKCNDTTSPDLDADIQNGVDMFQMLINLIKQSKPSVNLEESCTTVCDAPRPTRWDLAPPPNTKSEAAPKDYSVLIEDMMSTVITSESSVSKENTEKPTAVTINKMTSSSEITVIQQSQDEEIKTEEINIQEVKMKNSQGSMQTSQPKIQVSHNKDQFKVFSIDGGVQTSQQKQELPVTSDTPVVPSQCPTPQSQDQMQREPSNTGTVQIQQTQVQVQQSQVVQLQPQIEVAPSQHAIQQTQGHPQQRPIYARVTTRPQNTLYLPGDGDDGQNISINTSFQMSQELPVNTITSNSLVLTGYGQFVQTSYPATGNIGSILNIPVQHIYSHSSAYPSHVHHQLHAQQCYTLMQPFIQNVPNPGASEWFNTNGQLQPGAQTHVAWSNGAAAGTTNVVYSNAVQFNTASLQSYTNNYNNVQEYNRVSMQNHSHTQSFPGSMDSQSFPHRQ